MIEMKSGGKMMFARDCQALSAYTVRQLHEFSFGELFGCTVKHKIMMTQKLDDDVYRKRHHGYSSRKCAIHINTGSKK